MAGLLPLWSGCLKGIAFALHQIAQCSHTTITSIHTPSTQAHAAVVHPCRCFADGQFEQAVGIALEARRLDKLEQTIKSSPDMVKILTYSLQVCQTLVISREFRQQVSPIPAVTPGGQVLCFPAGSIHAEGHTIMQAHTVQVLRLLIKLYESVPEPDWVNICQCLMFLDDSEEVAKILHNLIEGNEVWLSLDLGCPG